MFRFSFSLAECAYNGYTDAMNRHLDDEWREWCLDTWSYQTMVSYLLREQQLRDGNPLADPTEHKLEIQRFLFFLQDCSGRGPGAACREVMLQVFEKLLRRQGLPRHHGLWSCLVNQPIPGDAWIDYVVEYSLLVAGFCHHCASNSKLKVKAEADAAILACMRDFVKGHTFPSHGFDRDVDYEMYAKYIILGKLDHWILDHWKALPDFETAAVGLVDEETVCGPVGNPWQQCERDGQYSPLGELCLQMLAKAQKIYKSKT